MTDKERLIRQVRRDWLAGMSQVDIKRKHNVTEGFVRYHTVDKEYERNRPARKREAQRVDVECRVCGDHASITVGAIEKRERRGMGPYRCRPCGQYGHPAEAKPIDVADPKDEWRLPEEIVDGEHGIRHWAWRYVKAMSKNDRQLLVQSIDRLALRDVDDSRSARHAKPQREREEFRAAPYAKLDVPFGAAARGEKAA